MSKLVVSKPDWLDAPQVGDIYSVSGCVSKDFMDWISHWKHNGFWFFDSPDVIRSLAEAEGVSLTENTLFYYLAYHLQWDEFEAAWEPYSPDPAFDTEIVIPLCPQLEGVDIVSFSCGNSAECSPLTCNHLAQEISVNAHGLLGSVSEAKGLLEAGQLKGCEPGPYRIFEVYTVSV